MSASSDYNFAILDETEDWLVVDKPAPLQIHPSKPSDAGLTLWDGIRELLAYELANGGQVSIINRLDRETSGVVLIAKTGPAARRLGKAMMRRQMEKTYLAVVAGWPEWEETTVTAPILRQGEVMDSRIWVKQRVDERGVPCESHFQVRERHENRQVSSPWWSVPRTPAACTSSACIWPIWGTTWWVTRSTAHPRIATWSSSRRDGRPNWRPSCTSPARRCTPIVSFWMTARAGRNGWPRCRWSCRRFSPPDPPEGCLLAAQTHVGTYLLLTPIDFLS